MGKKRKIPKILRHRFVIGGISVAGLVLLALGAGAWILFTSSGSGWAVRQAIRRGFKTADVKIERFEGALGRELVLQDLHVGNPPGLPKGTVIQAQRVSLVLRPWDWEQSQMNLFNGRLQLPDASTVVFSGQYAQGQLKFPIYTQVVNIRHMLSLFTDAPQLASVGGTLRDMTAQVGGTWRRPTLAGKFQLDELKRGPFQLKDCPAIFNFELRELPLPGQSTALHGALRCESGKVTVKQTTVNLAPSSLVFVGDVQQPNIQAKAFASIGDTDITLTVRGPIRNPEIAAHSHPPRDPTRLLLMLATGQSWDKTEKALQEGTLSLGAAREFANYLIFGSHPRPGLGGVDVTVKYEEDVRGLGASVRLSNRLELGYDLEQTQATIGADEIMKHRISAQQQVGRQTSLEVQVEREAVSSTQPQDDLWLKLKRQF